MVKFKVLMTLSCLSLWVTSVLGCSDDSDDIPRKLTNYRILAMVADPPQISLSDLMVGQAPTVKVRAIDFEPEDISRVQRRSYTWTLCFSIGAVTQFSCLDDEYSITMSTDAPIFEFTPDFELLARLLPSRFLTEAQSNSSVGQLTVVSDSQPCGVSAGTECASTDGCPSNYTCTGGRCAPPSALSPLPLVVKVRGKTEQGDVRLAARSIGVRVFGNLNQNPDIESVRIGNGELDLSDAFDGTCTVVGPFDSRLDVVPMELEVAQNSVEDYPLFDGAKCVTQSEFDGVTVAWYASGGDLERGMSDAEQMQNTLRLGLSDDDVRLYVVVRDGRGGLTAQCLHFLVEHKP